MSLALCTDNGAWCLSNSCTNSDLAKFDQYFWHSPNQNMNLKTLLQACTHFNMLSTGLTADILRTSAGVTNEWLRFIKCHSKPGQWVSMHSTRALEQAHLNWSVIEMLRNVFASPAQQSLVLESQRQHVWKRRTDKTRIEMDAFTPFKHPVRMCSRYWQPSQKAILVLKMQFVSNPSQHYLTWLFFLIS